jgi:hypothetical protein
MVESMKQRKPIQVSNIPQMNLLKREIPLEPKEYTSFFDIPKPQQIDFSEKLDDEVITNMDELIENQKKLRERELQEYAPPPPVGSPNPGDIKINISDPKIKILEQLPKEVIRPIEKHVHFESHDETKQMVHELKEKIENMSQRLEEFIAMFNQSKPTQNENPVNVLKKLIAEQI